MWTFILSRYLSVLICQKSQTKSAKNIEFQNFRIYRYFSDLVLILFIRYNTAVFDVPVLRTLTVYRGMARLVSYSLHYRRKQTSSNIHTFKYHALWMAQTSNAETIAERAFALTHGVWCREHLHCIQLCAQRRIY